MDRNGEILYEIYVDKNRTPIKLTDLPDYVKQATISIEDKNFYRHMGIDIAGVTRAAISTLSGKRLEGGSTITQQLVKMALLTPQRTVTRKIKEAVLALATEIIYSKDQILELYLNHAPYGGTAYGIEQAAKLYFGKPARELTLAEAAFLAGLPQAPSRYSPFGSHPENAKQRQKEVLRRMREDGYIDREQEEKMGEENLAIAKANLSIKAPHFVLWIKDLLEEKYGQITVEKGGLRVTTTLDFDIQEKAQASVSAEVKKLSKMKVGNGAAMVTNPSTGEILAMVGSKDYFDEEYDGKVNVTLRPRQPGSSIKPLMYAAGFSTGKINPATMWLDIPTCFTVTGQPLYCPKNYDGSFHGPVQVRFALGNSYNIPAVKSLAYIGVDDMIATASAMGITTFKDPAQYGLSLTLGGGEVTMYDMATAFGTLANNGIKVPLNPFLKIADYKGKILYERPVEEKLQVLPPEAAYLLSHILLDNNARSGAFGSASELVIPNQVVAVKTGTTNDLRDNWTIGYTPERLAAVWVGNNDNSQMNPYLVSGVTGAAPIWNDIMRMVLKNRKPLWPEKPEGVVGRDICSITGKLAPPAGGENPCDTRHEYFWEKYLPDNNYAVQKEIWIRKDNGQVLDPAIPADQQGEIELQMHTMLSDLLIPEFCLDCSYPIVEEAQISYPRSVINVEQKP